MADPGSPLVSVLMPAYNHERFVREAIESAWKQSHANIELVVIDDGSSDGTLRILEELAAASPVPMQVRTQANQGIARTLNSLVADARGEWLAFLSSDDFYSPQFIERNLAAAAAAAAGERGVVIHSDAWIVEAGGGVTGRIGPLRSTSPARGDAFDLIATGKAHVVSAGIFLRRDLLLAAGGFDPTMVAEDLDLHLRLARRARFHYLDEPLFFSRHTPGSLGKRPWLWGDSIIRSLAKHEDILGSRLPALLSKSSENIAVACFEQGERRPGLHWARRALAYAPGLSAQSATAARLAVRSARATTRSLAVRLFGRERLVRVKRKLQRA